MYITFQSNTLFCYIIKEDKDKIIYCKIFTSSVRYVHGRERQYITLCNIKWHQKRINFLVQLTSNFMQYSSVYYFEGLCCICHPIERLRKLCGIIHFSISFMFRCLRNVLGQILSNNIPKQESFSIFLLVI